MTTYRIVIDGLACSGFGDCADLAPDVFELDSHGKAFLRVGTSPDPVVLEAAAACPMSAIRVEGEAYADPQMSLRSWIRGHRNVFSYTNESVEAGPDDVDMLEEEYGERATEEEALHSSRSLRWQPWRWSWGWLAAFGRLGGGGGSSVDGILEIGKDSAEEEKPRPSRTP